MAAWVFPGIITEIFGEASNSLTKYDDDYIEEDVSYEKFISIIDECNMHGHRLPLPDREWYCGVDDNFYQFTFNKWMDFRLQRFDMKISDYVEIKPIKKSTLQKIEVEFKTGNLIISDWFRDDHDKLSKLCEFLEDAEYENDSIKSINSSLGREQRTKAYYEQLGIIHVHVSNTCPNIFQNGNCVVVGDEKKTHCDFQTKKLYQEYVEKTYGGFVNKGSVCTDLWWTTIIEEEKLTEILGSEYQDIYNTATKIKVKPGKYILSFTGDHEKFKDFCKGKKSPFKGRGIVPFFVFDIVS